MSGYDPSAVDRLLERLRNVRESDLQRSGEFGGRLVSELADRAVLIGCVLLVVDGRGGCGTGQRQRQEGDPGAPAKAASSEPCVYGSSFDHHLRRWQRLHRGGKGSKGRADGFRTALVAFGPAWTRLTPARFCF